MFHTIASSAWCQAIRSLECGKMPGSEPHSEVHFETQGRTRYLGLCFLSLVSVAYSPGPFFCLFVCILIQTHCLLPRHYDSWYLLHFWPPLIQNFTFTSHIHVFYDLIMSLKSDLELHLVFMFTLPLLPWDPYSIKHHWQRHLNLTWPLTC